MHLIQLMACHGLVEAQETKISMLNMWQLSTGPLRLLRDLGSTSLTVFGLSSRRHSRVSVRLE